MVILLLGLELGALEESCWPSSGHITASDTGEEVKRAVDVPDVLVHGNATKGGNYQYL